MTTTDRILTQDLAVLGKNIGEAVREHVYSVPIERAAQPVKSPLKPGEDSFARAIDAAGEQVGFDYLTEFSDQRELDMHVIVDPANGTTVPIRDTGNSERVFVYFDAVDGTIKPAGLGNDSEQHRIRAATDGVWGTGMAFTGMTSKPLEALTVGDFETSVLVDGNPSTYVTYPQVACAMNLDGNLESFSVDGHHPRRIYTSTNENLGQSMVSYDAFQAFDRNSNSGEDEALARVLYGRLINRHEGGAFDVLRTYGSLAALQRHMFGWRDGPAWFESQGGGFVAINENLPNMIPSVPLVEGAGGIAIDFAGYPLRNLELIRGRTNVIYAANEVIAEKLLDHAQQAYKAIRE